MKYVCVQIKRILISILAIIVLLPNVGWCIVSAQTEGTAQDPVVTTSGMVDDFLSYVAAHESDSQPQTAVVLSMSEVICSNGAEQQAEGVYIPDRGTVGWTTTVETSGWYQFEVTYRYTDANELINALAEMRINGAVPFSEAAELQFYRLWKDSTIEQDENGNDVMPKQIQLLNDITTELLDETGHVRAYTFWLEEGPNTIEMSFQRGGLVLKEAQFCNKPILDYETYRQNGHSAQTDEGLYFQQVIQAETMTSRNDSAIVPAKDRSGPATIPSDPMASRFNIVDGSSYKTPGQSLSWEIEVPEDGYYRIGMRCKQSTVEGLSVYRRITVDGELPYSEADEWSIPYSSNWGYYEFGGDMPQYLYLTKGTHTLSMEVITGGSGTLEARLEKVVATLNDLYRKILVITGSTPDTYRDYQLDVEIPELVPTFEKMAAELAAIREEAASLSGQTGGQMSILGQIESQLRDFVKKPADVPNRLSYYKSNISSLASLMLSLQTQPLSVDYLVLSGEKAPQVKTEAGFGESFVYHFLAFIGSFFSDYEQEQSATDENATQTITAWYSGGREQLEILKQMVEESFTPEEKINVDLKLAQIALTTAILSGNAPDVVLSIARGQPVNLAARGVVAPLSEMEGFREVSTWFSENAMMPYTYEGEVYGVPVTMDFHVLFYRKDILEELGISVPQTWNDVYEILPVLQRNNMAFGLPYTAMSTQATIDSGMGAKDIFPTLLMQRKADFYSQDLTEVALDTTEALSAFREWTEFYTQYGFDLTYDFQNRFRTGEMPLGIQSYSAYNQLSATAPEIKGLWDFTLIPGTLQEDGTIDRSEATSGTAAILLHDSQNKEAAWKFLKWWIGEEAQSTYGNRVELLMGTASRSNTANVHAIKRLSWTETQVKTILEQMTWTCEIPEVVGGYYASRGLDNAFRNVVLSGENYREALMEQSVKINDELERKRQEIHAGRKEENN